MKKAILFFVFVLGLFPFRVEAQVAAPEVWLKNKGEALFEALAEQDIKKRYAKIKNIATEVFHPDEFPRLALGAPWQRFSTQQKASFKNVFFDYFVVQYASFPFKEKADFKIEEKKIVGKDIMLRTSLASDSFKRRQSKEEEGLFIEVYFALRASPKGGYYIRDAKVTGSGVFDVSILMFLRETLTKKYQEAQSDPAVLIRLMENEISKKYRAAEELSKVQSKP